MKSAHKIIFVLALFIGVNSFAQHQGRVSKSPGFKSRQWDHFDLLDLQNGKLLSWEKSYKDYFIRVYKENLRVDQSFKFEFKKNKGKNFSELVDFNGKLYLMYDDYLPLKKEHVVFAREIDLENRKVKEDTVRMASFRIKALNAGHWSIHTQTNDRLLLIYNPNFNDDDKQQMYFKVVGADLRGRNEANYKFDHKGELFNRIKHLLLPNDDVIIYGQQTSSSQKAREYEIQELGTCKYQIMKFTGDSIPSSTYTMDFPDKFTSEMLVQYKNHNLYMFGIYSTYSNRHGNGVYYNRLDDKLQPIDKMTEFEFDNNFTGNMNKSTARYTEELGVGVQPAGRILLKKNHRRTVEHDGIWGYNIKDVEVTDKTYNFYLSQKYMYTQKQADFDGTGAAMISHMKTNFIEGQIIYMKIDIIDKEIRNFQHIDRLYVGYDKDKAEVSTMEIAELEGGDKYMYFFQANKVELWFKAADEYTFTNYQTFEYEKSRYKGDFLLFSKENKATYSTEFKKRRVYLVKCE